MLPKKERFQIGATQRRAERNFSSMHFGLSVFPKKEEKRTFGILFKKKTVPNAVKRNATKRMFFEYIAQKKEKLPEKDILVILRKKPKSYEKKEIQNELETLFKPLFRL